MVRNIKARPPWQGSQAGLYWHPRDSTGQGERGPGGGGCLSPLPAPRSPLPPPLPRGTRSHQPLVGGAPAPANVSPAVFCVFQNRGVLAPAGAPSSGRLCLHARRLAKSAAASLAVLRRVVMVTPGEKSTRRGPQRADKGLGGEACGPPALLMFNLSWRAGGDRPRCSAPCRGCRPLPATPGWAAWGPRWVPARCTAPSCPAGLASPWKLG